MTNAEAHVPKPFPTLIARPASSCSTWALIALFAAYAFFLFAHVEAGAGGSDSSGYMNQARLLSQGEIQVPQRVVSSLDPEQFDWFTFIPLGFQPLPATREMVPSYPIGLPLLLIGLAQGVGWQAAPPFAMLLSALLGVALMIPLGRLAGLPRAWTWFGAFLLAASPLYTAVSVQLFTDVPATTAAIATILCAWQSRSHRLWAGVAGVLLALAVLIRPSNAVLLAPVALCLGPDWRRWLWLGLGGLPGAAVQCGYNLHAYGGAFKSGYGAVGSLFSPAFVPGILLHYAKWLPVLLTPIGLLVFALPWMRPRPRFANVLIAWVAVVLVFYVGYRHTSETWWYLRFVLPAFPAAIVGGLWVARAFWLRLSPLSFPVRHARSLAVAVVVAVAVFSVSWHTLLSAGRAGTSESMYPGAVAWAQSHLPPDAVVLSMQCSGALAYHTGFTLVRWDQMNPTRFKLLAQACAQSGSPLYAMLFKHEEKDALSVKLPGRWKKLGQHQLISVWELSPAVLP